jgi:hypothetical protein
LLFVGLYGALGYVAFTKDAEARKSVALAQSLVQSAYAKVQGLVGGSSKSKLNDFS